MKTITYPDDVSVGDWVCVLSDVNGSRWSGIPYKVIGLDYPFMSVLLASDCTHLGVLDMRYLNIRKPDASYVASFTDHYKVMWKAYESKKGSGDDVVDS